MDQRCQRNAFDVVLPDLSDSLGTLDCASGPFAEPSARGRLIFRGPILQGALRGHGAIGYSFDGFEEMATA